jgi:hypothetical protein
MIWKTTEMELDYPIALSLTNLLTFSAAGERKEDKTYDIEPTDH